MKYNFLLIKIIFFIFFLFNIFTNIVQASNKVFIVMKVNNEIITNININEEYRYLIALNADLKSLKKEEIFKLAKNSYLINLYDLSFLTIFMFQKIIMIFLLN